MTHRNDLHQSGARRVAKALRAMITDVNRAQRAWFDDFVRLDTVAGRGDDVRR